jgi:hypothetical protein
MGRTSLVREALARCRETSSMSNTLVGPSGSVSNFSVFTASSPPGPCAEDVRTSFSGNSWK